MAATAAPPALKTRRSDPARLPHWTPRVVGMARSCAQSFARAPPSNNKKPRRRSDPAPGFVLRQRRFGARQCAVAAWPLVAVSPSQSGQPARRLASRARARSSALA